MCDWDAIFAGVSLINIGSYSYLQDSILNFFEKTDANGSVPSCLYPISDKSNRTAHAKPILIQTAYLLSKRGNTAKMWNVYKNKMQSLLDYWHDNRREENGLYTWYDK